MTPEGKRTTKDVVKLMPPTSERVSAAPTSLPRPLVGGLMALGFGAVFGVLGMFLMPYTQVVGVSLIVAGGASAIAGVILVMKFAGDPRFDPRPTVRADSPPDSRQ